MLHAVLGEAACLGVAWAASERRLSVRWRTVGGGVALQIVLALVLLYLPPARALLQLLNRSADALQAATDAGTGLVFGYLGGAPLPFAESHPGASFILAFQALPIVLLISALGALLFHWGVLQRITAAFAWLLRRVLGIGGALALGAAVHVFVGMVEAPLLVRPYLERMQRGELFALMSCGMAGVAGTVMVIYAGFLSPLVPDALGNILTASVISTPAALAVAALMVPAAPPARDEARLVAADRAASSLDALVQGTAAGIPILIGIVSTLIVAVAVVAMVNIALGLLPAFGGEAISLQRIFAWPFRPVMWLIGVPWAESAEAARLMATKTVLNEFVAYRDLAALPPAAFAPRTRLILTYALCGFANFGSLGIMIGGLGAMVPGRRAEVVELGMRSILSGTLATCMSGALIGAIAP
ncbi:MAG TPA: nucleoside transporter C-terminal domain-containing protein [Acetobacteraceae bacterium]|nr:nucleoside transporter C-terminal domain-containing protein [Acetobacteraceae bacterium]